MTDQLETRGLRAHLWIARKYMFYDPVPLAWAHMRKTLVTDVSDGGARQDFLFGAATLPNVLRTHEFTLQFSDLPSDSDIDFLGSITALGQPIDFGIFKPEHDIFDGDGVTKDFLLPRRILYPAITLPVDATPFDWYSPNVILWSGPFGVSSSTPTPFTMVEKNSGNIGTGSPASGEAWYESDGHMDGSRWRTRIRVGTAPSAAPDVLEVVYCPLDRCTITKEQDRQFQQRLSETRGLTFREIW